MKTPSKAEIKAAQDAARTKLLIWAKDMDVSIVHIFNEDTPYGGLTVAFQQVGPYQTGKMVQVAVQTCSEEDAFSRKLGTLGALQKFYDGETINLPILTNYRAEDINYAVKLVFSQMYSAIID